MSDSPRRFYEDRTTLIEWLEALQDTGEIVTLEDGLHAIEKASRWSDAEAHRLIDRYRAAQDAEELVA